MAPVLHHPDQHLGRLVSSHGQPLGGAAPYLGRQSAMDLADDRALYRLATAPLARLQRAVAAHNPGRAAHIWTRCGCASYPSAESYALIEAYAELIRSEITP